MFFKKENLNNENATEKPPINGRFASREIREDTDGIRPPRRRNNDINRERAAEIEESLEEIYKDEHGDVVDVRSLPIQRRNGFVFWFLSTVFFLAIIAGIGYGGYYLYMSKGSDANAVKISIDAPEKVVAGEELSVTINYSNAMSVKAKNARIELVLPENLEILDSDPVMSEKNVWLPGDLLARSSSDIKLKVRIINTQDSSNLILARLTYTPENFSSEFKQEATQIVSVKSIGLDSDFVYSSNALVGNENEIDIKLKAEDENYFNDFRIIMSPQDNLQIIDPQGDQAAEIDPVFKLISNGVWEVSNLGTEEKVLPLKYKYKEKVSDSQDLNIKFVATSTDGQDHIFLEKQITQNVVKSDLGLTLEVNKQSGDTGVNFGDKLSYAVKYANIGDTPMKDVVIMAVIDSDFIDWKSLDDPNNGLAKTDSITWSKDQVPALSQLDGGQSGEIDFTINTSGFKETDLGKKFEISSYAQFSIGNAEDFQDSTDNRSNVIVNKINSNLNLKEELRYFSEDNLPVGTGPLPPKVGETTSFKVYWTLTNDLHELNGARVVLALPSYVQFAGKNQASVGTVQYDSTTNQVIWNIGRLPTSVYQANAEFSISVTPTEDDQDRIMVLLPGTKYEATDTETHALISGTTKAKTTRLEDDDIAGMNNDGRVQ